ncbi:MAG: hypothetical protein H7288_21105 [Kineosporiaceae bacterium]|nr:hypothetical protein [Aeromicrobium sp.]
MSLSTGARRLALGAFTLVVVALIAVAAVTISRSGDEQATASKVDLSAGSGQGANAAPPWLLPVDVLARVKAAGLNLGAMGMAEHYHVHLDILIDGKAVPVPADVGVDPSDGSMSALHSHSNDGIVHIEAATKGQAFTLGQFFTQWDVSLSGNQIGSLAARDGKSLKAFVNGKEVTSNPAMIRLAASQQITLVFGPTDAQVKVPESFDFGNEL